MKKLLSAAFLAVVLVAPLACSKQQEPSAPTQPTQPQAAPTAASDATATAPEAAEPAATEESTPAAPTETVTETDDAQETADQATTGVQSPLRLANAPSTPPAEHFKEGTNYRKVVPAQPTNVAPGKVEVVEFFWYGCGHCFKLDPAIEAWRSKGKPQYVEFVRVPAMWNDQLRMHARLFYTAEALGKLDALHSTIFREINVNGDPLNTVERMTAFFKKHGVGADEFQKAFASFSVESKLQRADFLNRRYAIDSVPQVAVNGKYLTDEGKAGGEPQLFQLIQELAAHEHGG